MKQQTYFIAMLMLATLALAACSASEGPSLDAAPTVDTIEMPEVNTPPGGDLSSGAATAAQTVVDEQGAVAVSVTPLNIGQDATSMDFEVALNTHSVDLSMDLAKLATLTTDTSVTVSATSWDAPRGGHHVSGVLSFPASVDGAALLEGAARITLTLENVDAPARTFVWNPN